MFKNLNCETLGVSGHQWERIELALSFGFRGMDLDLVDFADRIEVGGMEFARRLIDSAKIKIGGAHADLDLEADDEAFQKQLEKLTSLAPSAAEIGCKNFYVALAPASDARPYHENFEVYRKRVSEVAKALDDHECRLGLKFSASASLREGKQFEFIHDLGAAETFVSTVGAANVGLLVDLWQLFLAGAGVDDVAKLSVDQIVAVSVCDAPEDTPAEECKDEMRLLPGETGVIDTPAVLSVLAEKSFRGPVTPTPHPKRFRGTPRDRIVKLAGESLNNVWTAADLARPSSPVAAMAEAPEE